MWREYFYSYEIESLYNHSTNSPMLSSMKTGNSPEMGHRQFSNFEHFVKPNMFFVCFNEVCVFSNPSEEHASRTILESLVSGMLWFQPLTFIQNGSKLVTLLEFSVF